MLGISPSFLTYLERAARGDRVIWQSGMRLLSCFGEKFSGDHNRLVSGNYIGGMFELVYEFDTNGYWDEKKPSGIVFWCADSQLINRKELLESLRDDGSLPAILVLKDAIRFLKETISLGNDMRPHVARAYRFLRREKIIIPSEELKAMLGDIIRH